MCTASEKHLGVLGPCVLQWHNSGGGNRHRKGPEILPVYSFGEELQQLWRRIRNTGIRNPGRENDTAKNPKQSQWFKSIRILELRQEVLKLQLDIYR